LVHLIDGLRLLKRIEVILTSGAVTIYNNDEILAHIGSPYHRPSIAQILSKVNTNRRYERIYLRNKNRATIADRPIDFFIYQGYTRELPPIPT
jgi:hypothetical protein